LQNMVNWMIGLLQTVPAVLIALTFHEFCHGYTAYLLGDPTAKNSGRLSLNPLKHLDPIGFLCMVIAKFGWAKPVPVNMYYFKKPKRDMAIVALAGPLSNIVLGIVSVFISYILFFYFSHIAFLTAMAQFFYLLAILSVGFAVFNLIPLPPLDGSRILGLIVPDRIYYKLMQYEHYIQLGFMALLILPRFTPVPDVVSVFLTYARMFVMSGIESIVTWILL